MDLFSVVVVVGAVETVEKRLPPFGGLKNALGKAMENAFVFHAFSITQFLFEGR